MADFLTTKSIAYQLEEVIKKAKQQLYIFTPYLKLSETYFERLKEATDKNIECTVVYGKTDLTKHDENLLNQLRCNIYFKENLHGKCFANENTAIITSMNLHSFSEANNREFGVLLCRKKDNEAYIDCINEINSIIKQAKEIRIIDELTKVSNYESNDFITCWFQYLKVNFPNVKFEKNDSLILADNFPFEKVKFSTKYGFITLSFDKFSKIVTARNLNQLDHLNNLFSNYRFFWNNSTQLSIYHLSKIEFQSIDEELKYCATGLNLLINELFKIK